MKNFIEKLTWLPFHLNRIISHKKSIVCVDVDGFKFKMKLIEDDSPYSLTSTLRSCGMREPRNVRNYIKFIDKNDIVLDVGANVGFFTLLSRNAKKIIAIEPIKRCLGILEDNLKLNNINNVEIYNLALGDGKDVNFMEAESLNQSRVVKGKGYKVKSKKLNYFVKKFKVNMIKIDVEGYEYEVFKKGIPKRVDKIMIEFHTDLLGKDKSTKLLNLFEKEGFYVDKIIEDMPLRLYPFIRFWDYLSWEKKGLSYHEVRRLIGQGRGLKYLYLRRKK